MVIKNLAWKRFHPLGLMTYIADKDKAPSMVKPIYWNMPTPNFYGALNAFKKNHEYRNLKKNSNVLLHDILSFSPKDSKDLNEDKIRDITYKYLQLRATNNLAFAQIHWDKSHYHVHIAISPNAYKEKNVTHINNQKYKDIRVELEQYQEKEYPELDNSIVFLREQKAKNERETLGEFEAHKKGKVLLKDELKSLAKNIFEQSTSIDEFYSKLVQHEGVKLYAQRGKTKGILFDGKKYRFKTLGIEKEMFDGIQAKEQSLVDKLISMQTHKSKQKSKGLER